MRTGWLVVAGFLFVVPAGARLVREPPAPGVQTGGQPVKAGHELHLCTGPDASVAFVGWPYFQSACAPQPDNYLQRTTAAVGLAITRAMTAQSARWHLFRLLRGNPGPCRNIVHSVHGASTVCR